MRNVTILKKRIESITGAGDGASLVGASIRMGSKKTLPPSRYRLFIEDGTFPQMAFNAALRQLTGLGIKSSQIKGVDFNGKLKGDLEKHVINTAQILLGDKIKVRQNVPLKKCEKSVRKDLDKI